MPTAQRVDVVVVGAGLSGLTAATRLMESGRTVVVIEARNRVGGRMVRQKVMGGAWVDLGGQWIGPTQDRIVALAQQLGVRTFDSYHAGNDVLVWDGASALVNANSESLSGSPPLSEADLMDLNQVIAKIGDISATIPADAPWSAPNAASLDAQTLASWLEGAAKTRFANWKIASLARIGGSGSFEPGEVSILHFAWTQKVAPQAEMPEASLFYGGAGQIPLILAKRLGSRVQLGQAVRKVTYSDKSVTVETGSSSYSADAVIVAIPPTLTGEIDYDPPLPARRAQLTQRIPMGALLKFHAIYPTAFWRSMGLSGVGMGNLPTIEFTADSSPPSGSPGIMTAFIAGNRAVELGSATAATRREEVLRDLVTYFGPHASSPAQFIEFNWPAEEWTRGAFTSFLPPNGWTAYGEALRPQLGPIYWAGTETATRWPGYFDGAVRSGEAAADAVLARS